MPAACRAVVWRSAGSCEAHVTTQAILWRSFTWPGHEACRLEALDQGWQLAGCAVFAHQQQPCRLDYQVTCDAGWLTLAGQVRGWVGDTVVAIEIKVGAGQHWRLNGVERPAVAGCADLDLNFSPSTNLLPIRRLGLAIGQAAEVKAAWLRFPSFELEPLPQVYRRLDGATYRYESGGGRFVADLQVTPAGLVIDYPGLWQAEAIN